MLWTVRLRDVVVENRDENEMSGEVEGMNKVVGSSWQFEKGNVQLPSQAMCLVKYVSQFGLLACDLVTSCDFCGVVLWANVWC